MKPFVIHRRSISQSTNLDAMELAEQGADSGTVIVADEQSSGVGRRGRQWYSPKGNLYFSIVLKEHLHVPTLSFACALSVGISLEQIFSQHIENSKIPTLKYKWPNDVFVDNKKISGVLLQSKVQGHSIPWIVCGVGVNILHHPEYATSISSYIPDLKLTNIELLDVVLENQAKLLDIYSASGFAPLRSLWLKKAHALNSHVCITTSDGITHEGTFTDIGLDGSIVLKSGEDTLKLDYGSML
ncbi:biotin--[acetyl-CoA-carboxylase] ligase [Anaplasma phagocytophilum str. CRT53-1]|uniref:Biotin--[acetyl-CoA-carboxylase] ligase n=2 Tax=Anaplasma phagocytophilum TaxID=948 RepID=A0A0F3PZH1_ANAPH|nr:biotin--[acetyl-CoA-carboxylase] ligase [Anaplasma phagocytophilum]EOA62326.1 biotin--acetyl-CoA-carboxylase ligase [Anaplasma phagocytophilum str. CRT38]KJV85683.1 biotin--[acetyl-CoA-carboxylase] ligase [Anaplasma phagocytophilum str. CRT53-1]